VLLRTGGAGAYLDGYLQRAFVDIYTAGCTGGACAPTSTLTLPSAPGTFANATALDQPVARAPGAVGHPRLSNLGDGSRRVAVLGFAPLAAGGGRRLGEQALPGVGEALAEAGSRLLSAVGGGGRLLQSCTPTAPGLYCPSGTTSTTGVPCGAGLYCPGSGAPAGVQCPLGTYSPGGATFQASSDCLACTTAGNYCPVGSASDTTLCAAGSACATPALQTACAVGTYAYAGATACTACAAGYCLATGSATPASNPCAAGYICTSFSGGTQQAACPAGQFCPAGTGDATTFACPAGKFSTGGTGATTFAACTAGCSAGYCVAVGSGTATANQCSAGYFCPSATTPSTTQAPCPAGHFCLAGQTAGTTNACPAGTFSTGGAGATSQAAACFPCPAGFCTAAGSSTSNANPCAAGTVCATAGVTSGSACPVGSFCPAGVNASTPCPVGTFSGVTGLRACFSCAPGYCLAAGSNSATANPCQAGFYCPSSTTVGTAQVPCAAGYFCPAGTGAAPGTVALSGISTTTHVFTAPGLGVLAAGAQLFFKNSGSSLALAGTGCPTTGAALTGVPVFAAPTTFSITAINTVTHIVSAGTANFPLGTLTAGTPLAFAVGSATLSISGCNGFTAGTAAQLAAAGGFACAVGAGTFRIGTDAACTSTLLCTFASATLGTGLAVTVGNQFMASPAAPIWVSTATIANPGVFSAAVGTLVAGQRLRFSTAGSSTTTITVALCTGITDVASLVAVGAYACAPGAGTFQIGLESTCTTKCQVTGFIAGNNGLSVQPACTAVAVPTLGVITVSTTACPVGYFCPAGSAVAPSGGTNRCAAGFCAAAGSATATSNPCTAGFTCAQGAAAPAVASLVSAISAGATTSVFTTPSIKTLAAGTRLFFTQVGTTYTGTGSGCPTTAATLASLPTYAAPSTFSITAISTVTHIVSAGTANSPLGTLAAGTPLAFGAGSGNTLLIGGCNGFTAGTAAQLAAAGGFACAVGAGTFRIGTDVTCSAELLCTFSTASLVTGLSVTVGGQVRASSQAPVLVTAATIANPGVFSAAVGTLVAGQRLRFSTAGSSTTTITVALCTGITDVASLVAVGAYACAPGAGTFQIGLESTCTTRCQVTAFTLGNGGLLVQPVCSITGATPLGTLTVSAFSPASACPAGSYCPAGTGAGASYPCPVGTFSLAGASSLAACTACAAGNCLALGSTSATSNPCAAGFFCPTLAANTAQAACPAGFFLQRRTGLGHHKPLRLGLFLRWRRNGVLRVRRGLLHRHGKHLCHGKPLRRGTLLHGGRNVAHGRRLRCGRLLPRGDGRGHLYGLPSSRKCPDPVSGAV